MLTAQAFSVQNGQVIIDRAALAQAMASASAKAAQFNEIIKVNELGPGVGRNEIIKATADMIIPAPGNELMDEPVVVRDCYDMLTDEIIKTPDNMIV